MRRIHGRPFRPRQMPSDPAKLVVFLALLGLGAVALWQRVGETVTGTAHAIDGDSLRLAGRELRLLGIDAPELHQTCERDGRSYACGRVAQEALADFVARGSLTCHIGENDRYGRGLATCKSGEVDINATLVREGLAVAYDGYDAEEDEARAGRRGVWAGTFERPADWRRRHPR
ncbi:thermonuclease family protein [Chelatococcus sp. GCM10030263]|uniref:thermonuclease family protein n=1 Tax=Chelatococcus sp. GCM10030263 TaxID=3273387 RepID=UPI0036125981